MNLITVDELRKLMPKLSLASAAVFAKHLSAAMLEFEIVSKKRRCAFLSNLAHESSQLTSWEENLKYSAKRLTEVWPKRFPTIATAQPFANNPQALANRVYGTGNKAQDLGNIYPGDGYKYRGRGPIQLTGRSNYRQFGQILREDLEHNPDEASRPDLGFRIAAAFWQLRGLNELADKLTMSGDKHDRVVLTQICKRINGGTNGLSDRLNYFRVAKQVLHGDEAVHQEPAASDESPAEVSPDTDVDLLGAAVNSSHVKSAGQKLWPRITARFATGVPYLYGVYEAHRMTGSLIVLVLLIGLGALLYWKRKQIKALILKYLK